MSRWQFSAIAGIRRGKRSASNLGRSLERNNTQLGRGAEGTELSFLGEDGQWAGSFQATAKESRDQDSKPSRKCKCRVGAALQA